MYLQLKTIKKYFFNVLSYLKFVITIFIGLSIIIFVFFDGFLFILLKIWSVFIFTHIYLIDHSGGTILYDILIYPLLFAIAVFQCIHNSYLLFVIECFRFRSVPIIPVISLKERLRIRRRRKEKVRTPRKYRVFPPNNSERLYKEPLSFSKRFIINKFDKKWWIHHKKIRSFINNLNSGSNASNNLIFKVGIFKDLYKKIFSIKK